MKKRNEKANNIKENNRKSKIAAFTHRNNTKCFPFMNCFIGKLK